MGKKSEFVSGLRITDAETRDVALMGIACRVVKSLAAAIGSHVQVAVGFSGGDGHVFRARKKKTNPGLGFVGEIAATDPRWLEAIWTMGAVPVISSIALGFDGEYYNINADEMAAACAIGTKADTLVFLTDVPGVKGADGNVMRWLTLAQIPAMQKAQVVSGGMLPKLNACRDALSPHLGPLLPRAHRRTRSSAHRDQRPRPCLPVQQRHRSLGSCSQASSRPRRASSRRWPPHRHQIPRSRTQLPRPFHGLGGNH